MYLDGYKDTYLFLGIVGIVYIGDTDNLVANKDITQHIIMVDGRGDHEKQGHIRQILGEYQGQRVIIFCGILPPSLNASIA